MLPITSNTRGPIKDFMRELAKEVSNEDHDPCCPTNLQVCDIIGEGAFSFVYRGRLIKENMDVAIKAVILLHIIYHRYSYLTYFLGNR